MLPTPAAASRGHDQRQILAAYDGSSTVDVSGHDPSDVVAVTSGFAFVVSGIDGGVVDVLVVALSVGPVGGSEVVMASPLVAAVIAPIAMRTLTPNARRANLQVPLVSLFRFHVGPLRSTRSDGVGNRR